MDRPKPQFGRSTEPGASSFSRKQPEPDPDSLDSKLRESVIKVFEPYFRQMDDEPQGAWSEADVIRRTMGYIWKASKNLQQMESWQHVTKRFVTEAMKAYISACEEKVWFDYVNIGKVFTMFLSGIFRKSPFESPWKFKDLPTDDELAKHVDHIFRRSMTRSTFSRALWKVVEAMSNEPRERARMWQMLFKTAPHPDVPKDKVKDLELAQAWLKRWMEESIYRIRSANSDGVMDQTFFTSLFQKLLYPFGVQQNYTMIPIEYLKDGRGPPEKWDFIEKEVKRLLRWECSRGNNAKTKRSSWNHYSARRQAEQFVETPEQGSWLHLPKKSWRKSPCRPPEDGERISGKTATNGDKKKDDSARNGKVSLSSESSSSSSGPR